MPGKLTTKQRAEWLSQLRLSQTTYEEKIESSRIFDTAYRKNSAHWSNRHVPGVGDWTYDKIVANFVFANHNTVLPSVSMRHPKVLVKPSAHATRRWQRVGEGEGAALKRYVAAAMIQILENWRVREFNFKRQWDRALHDDWTRGLGVVRHGFTAEDGVIRTDKGNKQIFTEDHPHIRGGWPYMVHQKLDLFRWDAIADDHEARQWSAYGKYWRVEDLKADKRFTVPRDMEPTHLAGHLHLGRVNRDAMVGEHADALGRVLVWEIWDKRSAKIIYWVNTLEKEIGIEDWPVDVDNLPDSLMVTNETNDGIQGVSEVDQFWELQQELNKLISLILVYAKRSVPLTGINKAGIEPEEAEKIQDAEILELIMTSVDPASVIKKLDLNANFQPLILAAQFVMSLIRDVSGISRLQHGGRENVESATEAREIASGGAIRQATRVEKFREFASASIRKDFQILQQTKREEMLVDVVDMTRLPEVWQVTPEQIEFEYDFEIAVGSTEPDNPAQRKRDALAFTQAIQSHPEILNRIAPRFVVENIVWAFGVDPVEALAPEEGAQQQAMVQALQQQQQGGGKSNGAAGGSAGLGASLDALKLDDGGQTQ